MNKLFVFLIATSAGVSWALPEESAPAGAEFMKQLKSYCPVREFWRGDYEFVQGKEKRSATLTWKCPYRVAMRIEGPKGMEFIFNGAEAWFFYPARAVPSGQKAVELSKTEHYKNLDNRLLELWLNLWRDVAPESREQRQLEELYDLKFKVENGMQMFSFVAKKSEFPGLDIGFSLSDAAKLPKTVRFRSKDVGLVEALLMPASGKKITEPDQRSFNPEIPAAKTHLSFPP